jgi:uncharacterized membrane protein
MDNDNVANQGKHEQFQVKDKLNVSVVIDWLHAGVEDTHRAGWASLFYGFVFAATGICIHTFFSDNYWLLAGLTTGFFLLGPFLAIGLYDLSRRIELGLPPSLIPSLTAWRPNLFNVFLFAVLLLAVLLIWTRLSMDIFAYFFNGELPTFIHVFIHVVTLKQPTFALVYFSAGGFFAALIYAISVIAMPMMLDRKTSATTAAYTSLRVCIQHPIVMLMWACCIVVLVGVGFATSFLGLIITMPVAGHASWHVYRDLIENKR